MSEVFCSSGVQKPSFTAGTELAGDVPGGARRISYTHDGTWWRAADAATGGELWLSGPAGIFWEFDHPDGPIRVSPDVPAVLKGRVLPELSALGSVELLASWLGIRLDPAGAGRWRGVQDGRTAEVVTDVDTGVVTDVRMTGSRGISLRTPEFRLIAAAVSAFSYSGPSRGWRGPIAGPLAG